MKKYIMVMMVIVFTLGLGACSNVSHDKSTGHTNEKAHDRSFDIIR